MVRRAAARAVVARRRSQRPPRFPLPAELATVAMRHQAPLTRTGAPCRYFDAQMRNRLSPPNHAANGRVSTRTSGAAVAPEEAERQHFFPYRLGERQLDRGQPEGAGTASRRCSGRQYKSGAGRRHTGTCRQNVRHQVRGSQLPGVIRPLSAFSDLAIVLLHSPRRIDAGGTAWSCGS